VGTWAAPTADGPIKATVDLPPSKSQTNRALVLAALASGPSVLRNPLRARDTRLMAAALRALGAGITDDRGSWQVTPIPASQSPRFPAEETPIRIDCGLAGTVMRFVPPVATLGAIPVTFDGDPRARERPIHTTIESLRTLGARVDDGGHASLPFTVYGNGARGGAVTIDASASSQFVSGLLLTGPRWEKGVEVHHAGPPLPSLPHIAMTVNELGAVGVEVDDRDPDAWRVAPGPISGRVVNIEPDLSNAAPFLAAALLTGGRVTVPDWPTCTRQPGDGLRGILAAMGARVTRTGAGLMVEGVRLDGIAADLSDASELLTVVAALAALARTPSRLTGVAHVRGHEADRIACLATELTAVGGDVTELPDGLVIRPRALHGGIFRTYDDHRMATAAAVLGLAVPGIEIENVATTAKTMPDFTTRWLSMLGRSG
jgi:3-phosphoshikimate 1-carboxyvinyltransferase